MAISISGATNLAELIEALKGEQYSNAALADRIGIGQTTVQRMLTGGAVSDTVLERVAAYAKLSRERVYGLAFGLRTSEEPARYSERVELLARVVEELPADLQEIILVQARALANAREEQK